MSIGFVGGPGVSAERIVGGSGGAAIFVSAAPPEDPNLGDLWWDSIGGQLYVWYSDVNSSQWVIALNQDLVTAITANDTARTVSPVTGGTVTMSASDRNLYVATAPLASLTIKLTPYWEIPIIVELAFSGNITALTLQDSTGLLIPNGPIKAFGPGTAIVMRHTGTKWVYWK